MIDTYTQDEIADACIEAGISDGKCESLLIALSSARRASDRVRSTETEGLGPEGEERGGEAMRPNQSGE